MNDNCSIRHDFFAFATLPFLMALDFPSECARLGHRGSSLPNEIWAVCQPHLNRKERSLLVRISHFYFQLFGGQISLDIH